MASLVFNTLGTTTGRAFCGGQQSFRFYFLWVVVVCGFSFLAAHTLRIGNGGGRQGRGSRPPIDDKGPMRKFSIDPS